MPPRLRAVRRLFQDQVPQGLYRDLGDLEHAPRLLGLGLPGAPYRSVDGHRASLKVHLGPAQGAGFLGADAAEHTHGDVGPQAFSLSCVQHGKSLLQVERPRRPSRLSCGDGGQIRNIPDHQVVHHRVPDGLDQDHPGQPNAPG
jgi:hypothetical protein